VHVGTTTTDRTARREQLRAQRMELAGREAIAAEMLSRVVVPLPRPVANHVAILGFERLWFEYQKAMVARYPWGKAAPRNLTGVVASQVPGFTDIELAQFMITMLVIGELRLPDIGSTKKTVLDEIATLYEVDVSAIRKQVTSTMEAKQAKRASSQQSRSSRRTQAPTPTS
jgi:hypothetical protein